MTKKFWCGICYGISLSSFVVALTMPTTKMIGSMIVVSWIFLLLSLIIGD